MALLEHNLKVYNEAVEYFTNGGRDLLITQDTGTGKSYICIELLKTIFKGKKILYVVPKWSIAENFKEVDGYTEIYDRIDFITYNEFNSKAKVDTYLENYDVFVIDEAHHLGSDKYGAYLVSLLEKIQKSKGVYFLGMTATPVREDKVDVSNYFSKRLIGADLYSCILDGLINPFEYLVCTSKLLESYKNSEAINRLQIPGMGRASYKIDYLNSQDLLQEMVSKNSRNKWLCFFYSIRQLEQTMPLIRSLFPDYPIRVIHSLMNEDEATLKELNKMEKVIVLSVNKLLEGVHLKGFEGVLLFRNIGSMVVFRQIIGRLSSVNSGNNPVIIDCSTVAYKIFAKLQKEEIFNIKKYNKDNKYKDISKNKLGVFNVKLNNSFYYDMITLLQCSLAGSKPIIVNNKVYNSGKQFLESMGLTQGSFAAWLRAHTDETKNLGYSDIYQLFFDSLIEYNNRYYIISRNTYSNIAKDNGWDTTSFVFYRRNNEEKLKGLSIQEICDKYSEILAIRAERLLYQSLCEKHGVNYINFNAYVKNHPDLTDELEPEEAILKYAKTTSRVTATDICAKEEVSLAGFLRNRSKNKEIYEGLSIEDQVCLFKNTYRKRIGYRKLANERGWDFRHFERWRFRNQKLIEGSSLSEICDLYSKVHEEKIEKEKSNSVYYNGKQYPTALSVARDYGWDEDIFGRWYYSNKRKLGYVNINDFLNSKAYKNMMKVRSQQCQNKRKQHQV